MSPKQRILLPCLLFCVAVCTASAQSDQQSPRTEPASDLTTRSVKAIGYKVNGGSTKVDLTPTDLMPQAIGEAKVEAKTGATNIEVSLKNMQQPSKLGAEFLTYVLWPSRPTGAPATQAKSSSTRMAKGSSRRPLRHKPLP